MKKLVLSLLCLVTLGCEAQHLSRIYFFRSFTAQQLDSTLDANGVPSTLLNIQRGVDAYRIIYNTVNPDSTATIASGLMIIPKGVGCKFPLGCYAHGTTTKKSDAPSRMRGAEPLIGLVMGGLGYVAVLPDYLGLGDGPGLHPYQHAHSEATSVVDMLRATRDAQDSLLFKLNDQLFLTGYSQGGHACVAAHRLIQQQLSNEFTVTAAVPMSGAYDMSGVMVDVMLSDSVYPEPSYLPYLVYGWKGVYNFFSVDSDVIAHPYDTLLPPLFNGNTGIGTINAKAPQVPKHLFRPEVIDSFINNQNHFFRVALRDNDVYDWKPECPVQILFCGKDTRVSPKNAAVLVQHFKANGCAQCDTIDVNPALDHTPCAQVAVLYMKNFFEQFSHIDSCSANGIAAYDEVTAQMVHLRDQEVVRFSDLPLSSIIQVLTISGQNLIDIKTNNTGLDVPVDNLPNGIYLIQAGYDSKILLNRKLVISR
ncbi:MAG: lipase family protein [Chitinophagales bacterium]